MPPFSDFLRSFKSIHKHEARPNRNTKRLKKKKKKSTSPETYEHTTFVYWKFTISENTVPWVKCQLTVGPPSPEDLNELLQKLQREWISGNIPAKRLGTLCHLQAGEDPTGERGGRQLNNQGQEPTAENTLGWAGAPQVERHMPQGSKVDIWNQWPVFTHLQILGGNWAPSWACKD